MNTQNKIRYLDTNTIVLSNWGKDVYYDNIIKDIVIIMHDNKGTTILDSPFPIIGAYYIQDAICILVDPTYMFFHYHTWNIYTPEHIYSGKPGTNFFHYLTYNEICIPKS